MGVMVSGYISNHCGQDIYAVMHSVYLTSYGGHGMRIYIQSWYQDTYLVISSGYLASHGIRISIQSWWPWYLRISNQSWWSWYQDNYLVSISGL